MPQESNLEFKVGIFVFFALILLTVFIWSITDTSVFQEGKTIKVVFGFANGLKKNAPVRIAGVDEGIVQDIKLFFDREDGRTKASVELWVQLNTQIPNDSVITINQLGLLGEKYIEIVPGTESKSFIEKGETIVGKDPVAQEAISERVLNVAGQVEQSIAGINKIVNNEENREALTNTLKGVSSATQGISDLVEQTKTGEGTIGKLFYDGRLYDNLEGMTADLKENPWKLLYRPKERKSKLKSKSEKE